MSETAGDCQRGGPIAVSVFIDWRNCYGCARDAFGFDAESGKRGTIDTIRLAGELAGRRGDCGTRGVLKMLRIYSGIASQARSPKTYAAARRQFQRRENQGGPATHVVRRTLRYYGKQGREKGIDVALAVDLVRTTLFQPEHDVAVLVSADTDLLPAIEMIADLRGPDHIEVASWVGSPRAPALLSIAGRRLRQHRLDRALYDRLEDLTDYTRDLRPPQA